jgi:hypothetical protein
MVTEGFLEPVYREMLLIEERPDVLLDRLEGYVPPWKRSLS